MESEQLCPTLTVYLSKGQIMPTHSPCQSLDFTPHFAELQSGFPFVGIGEWRQSPFFLNFWFNLGALNIVWLSWFFHWWIPCFILFHLDTKNVRFGAFLTTWQLFEVLACRRLESESERAALRDAARLGKRVTIQSILVQSWPSWALNDHKE